MKLKASKKNFKGNKVLKVGYCQLQHLLKGKNPIAYSSGVYGWACDYYDMGNFYISTGYSPIGISVNHNIIKGYEETALQYACDYSMSYDKKTKILDNLLSEFIRVIDERL